MFFAQQHTTIIGCFSIQNLDYFLEMNTFIEFFTTIIIFIVVGVLSFLSLCHSVKLRTCVSVGHGFGGA